MGSVVFVAQSEHSAFVDHLAYLAAEGQKAGKVFVVILDYVIENGGIDFVLVLVYIYMCG